MYPEEKAHGEAHAPIIRYPEVDALRGIAILMMVVYHLLFDLHYFGVWTDINVYNGFWKNFALFCASLFVFLVGVSLSLSYERVRYRISGFALYTKYLLRGAFILLLGMAITAVTWLMVREAFIIFGILHLIGLSIIIAPLFFRMEKYTIIPGLIIIASSPLIGAINGPLWLAWLGVHPGQFISLDYEPLIPWFGLVLIGFGVGNLLYPQGKKRRCGGDIPFGPLPFLGRHSLLIYLIHQPLMIGAMALFGVISLSSYLSI